MGPAEGLVARLPWLLALPLRLDLLRLSLGLAVPVALLLLDPMQLTSSPLLPLRTLEVLYCLLVLRIQHLAPSPSVQARRNLLEAWILLWVRALMKLAQELQLPVVTV